MAEGTLCEGLEWHEKLSRDSASRVWHLDPPGHYQVLDLRNLTALTTLENGLDHSFTCTTTNTTTPSTTLVTWLLLLLLLTTTTATTTVTSTYYYCCFCCCYYHLLLLLLLHFLQNVVALFHCHTTSTTQQQNRLELHTSWPAYIHNNTTTITNSS